MAIEDIGSNAPSQLKLNNFSIGFLKETAKWTNFLSIVGFVMLGFLVLGAIFGGAMFATLYSSPEFAEFNDGAAIGGTFITILYLIIAVIYFFPIYYLYKFSGNMKRALVSKDEDTLTKALEYLKSHYKFVGILMIIGLSFYLLMFLLGLLGLAASSGGF